ncbi:hypothetical protein GIB67_014799 [Kingdonia uniflora]|uniref:Uncharacterized protein n=1 Tax=Kingdonia uniflora TaxID=39325 RepID=A0A7J7NVG1_9MAGN|nr:hypothetical protein GIB67_014799 [Kingdonia uniflora]
MMEGRGDGVIESSSTTGFPPSSGTNPIAQLQVGLKDLENKYRNWVTKQSLPVEAALATFTTAIQGSAIGGLMGTLTPPDIASSFSTATDAQTMNSLKHVQAFSGGPLIQVQNIAVMTGVNAGISCVMKRFRGKYDIQTSVVATFGFGALYSLISGLRKHSIYRSVALVETVDKKDPRQAKGKAKRGIFALGQRFSQPPTRDTFYTRTRGMLAGLGLQCYEKNFKKGPLIDITLPLLTDSAPNKRHAVCSKGWPSFKIEGCVISPSFKIDINGQIMGMFNSSKGIRKGDPLAPYLFDIAMQPLTDLLNKATVGRSITVFPNCTKSRIGKIQHRLGVMVF